MYAGIRHSANVWRAAARGYVSVQRGGGPSRATRMALRLAGYTRYAILPCAQRPPAVPPRAAVLLLRPPHPSCPRSSVACVSSDSPATSARRSAAPPEPLSTGCYASPQVPTVPPRAPVNFASRYSRAGRVVSASPALGGLIRRFLAALSFGLRTFFWRGLGMGELGGGFGGWSGVSSGWGPVFIG